MDIYPLPTALLPWYAIMRTGSMKNTANVSSMPPMPSIIKTKSPLTCSLIYPCRFPAVSPIAWASPYLMPAIAGRWTACNLIWCIPIPRFLPGLKRCAWPKSSISRWSVPFTANSTTILCSISTATISRGRVSTLSLSSFRSATASGPSATLPWKRSVNTAIKAPSP